MEIDWSSLIVDIVKKKDLDGKEFKDCWEDDYDWTELDKCVIENFKELLLEYGEVEAERIDKDMTKKELKKDLEEYYKENIKPNLNAKQEDDMLEAGREADTEVKEVKKNE